MIKDNTEIAIPLGASAVIGFDPFSQKSVLESASFRVGLINSDGNIRPKNSEPIKMTHLSAERLDDVKTIEDAYRRIWNDMKDPEEYYARSAIEPPLEG